MDHHFLGTRRTILKSLPLAALGAAAVGVAAEERIPPSRVRLAAATPRIVLPRDGDGGGARDVPLDGRLERVARGWRTPALPTSGFSMAAVSWRRGHRSAPVRIRTAKGGTWGEWRALPQHSDHGDSGEGRREGTDLVWLDRSDTVQVAFLGDAPPAAHLTLIDTAVTELDRKVAHDPAVRARMTTGGATPGRKQARRAPAMHVRAAWGPDDSLLNGSPRDCWTIKMVHIHHTAGSNDYSRADVPGIIRGIQRYHTQTLGWFDIGYNFVVDRFGRAWVARKDSYSRPVRGAHTLGFNHMSVGIAVIGNFQTATPSSAVIVKLGQLAGWKLHEYKRPAYGKAQVTSEGSDKYPKGRVVRLPRIDGHRNTNDTACPGNHLYARLPGIRKRARTFILSHS